MFLRGKGDVPHEDLAMAPGCIVRWTRGVGGLLPGEHDRAP